MSPNNFLYIYFPFRNQVLLVTRKDMTHGVISIDSILLNSMRNGKNVNFRRRKIGITSPPP